MHNKELVIEIFYQIKNAIETIEDRFKDVDNINYFLDTKRGQEKLDSICMQFIAIGESLKNIDKLTNKELLKQYETIDWKAVKGLRDVLSHHYFDLNAEAIYNVCNDDLKNLHKTINQIISDLKESK